MEGGRRNRFAANLRRLRNEEGLIQNDFANAHEVDRTYISGSERAVRNPTTRIVERLAKALAVDVTDLLSELPRDLDRDTGQPAKNQSGL